MLEKKHSSKVILDFQDLRTLFSRYPERLSNYVFFSIYLDNVGCDL